MKWGEGGSEGWALTSFHLLRWLSSCTCTCHIIKPSKLQKQALYHYKVWERKLVSVCFFEKVKTPKRTLEIDDLELPPGRKFSSCYEEGETPVEFASTVEEYYPKNFYSAEVLLWNSLDNGKTAFKSVAWRTFWSWTLAISLLFRND